MEIISKAVEKYKNDILETERYIWNNPETGYKEFKTSAYLAKKFEELGYKLTYADGITGFYTVVDTGRPGPEVLVLGELDSIICPDHKCADKETGAVHSCGHNAQCAALLGVAAALTDEDVISRLCGRIRLCAVPAEELLEIEYRNGLKKEGKIKYLGGKSEFLWRGYFDGVDLAFMVHTSGSFFANTNAVGCVAKKITYKGVSAHAGGCPWEGTNALYAASCGLNAINAIRETFRESDYIRVHPIITHGGDIVNAIPESVSLESYVRGKTFDAISAANERVNRALVGAALSLGANVDITDIPGYAPVYNDMGMCEVAKEAAELTMPGLDFPIRNATSTGSTDMGDLSCIMPIVHPYCSGSRGKSHGNDYEICDPIAACVTNAKWQVMMLTLLLKENGARAKKILADFKPLFASKDEFLRYKDSLSVSGERITYNEDGTAVANLK